FAVVFYHLRRRGRGALLPAAITLFAAATSTVHWLARPHVFTFLGVAVFGAVLDGWHARRLSGRWLWLLPPAMALWANVHGGFLIGFLLIGAYAGADVLRALAGADATAAGARRRLRSLAPVAGATLAATALNPSG